MAGPFVISMKLVGDATSGVAAVEQQRVSLEKLGATALGVQGNTANIAAQFQDIFVTAGMGMSPLQIALQQGTQLSAVLGNRGLGGTVSALGAAFASVLSPVSLVTIAVVALGAFGIQALAGLMSGTDKASEALERHEGWLDTVLVGYDDIREAAKKAADEALRLPSGSAALEIADDVEAAQAALDAQLQLIQGFDRIIDLQQDAYPRLGEEFGQLQDLLDRLAAGTLTVGEMDTALRSVKFSDSADDKVRAFVDDLLAAVEAASKLEANLKSAAAAAEGFSIDALIGGTFSQLNGASDAIEKLRGMTPDLRSAAERAQAIYDANSGSDVTGDLKRQLDYTLAQIAEAERRQEAQRTSRSGDKSSERWDASQEGLQQRIEQTRLETALLGQSTFEIERQRTALDLLNQAKQAGIPITDTVMAQIGEMSSEYATAQVELEQATEAQRRFNEELDFYKGTFNSFFGDLKSGLQDGLSMWDAFANAGANALDRIADRALGMAADGIFDMIFGAVMGGLTGGFGSLGNGIGSGATWGGLQNFLASANGNVFQSAGLSAYSNSIVERPTVFPFARGIGLMGEAGPEAIMPLKRTSSGALGVQVAGGDRSGGGVVFQLIDQRSRGTVKREEATGPNGERIIRAIIRDEVRQASRRGAAGF